MTTNRTHSALQHAMQYPSGHLDRFAAFGPAFEMMSPSDSSNTPAQPIVTAPAEDDNREMSKEFDARRFITGGNATFTLQGLRDRYTYKVTQSDPDNRGNTVYFIALLTGPDNTADYTYMGLVDAGTGAVRLTRKSRYVDTSQPVVAVRWALRRIWAGVTIAPARIYHVGRCGRCGRALTVPASIESGFGPECLGRLGGGE